MSGLPLILLIAIFLVAAAVVWVAGIELSNSVDVLDERLHIGSALGGLVLLAIATNLPEIAITVSAALSHNLGIAIGNILGGVAIQTLVLAVLDVVGVRGRHPLTYQAASLTLVLEAAVVVAVLAVAVMGSQLPAHVFALRLTPAAVLITAIWLVGLWLVGRARTELPWSDSGHAPDSQPAPRGHAQVKKERRATKHGQSTGRAAMIFGIGALVTLVAGVVLERSGEAIAGHIGLSGVLFGSTFLAAATALPEVSTGLTSVRLGDYKLAMSDIFGGNAFLPVLFVVADLLSGQPVLPKAQASDIYLTGLGVLLTAVYVVGLIFRQQRRVLRMGVESLTVVVFYVLGIVGLIALAAGKG